MYDIRARASAPTRRPRRTPGRAAADLSWLPPAPLSAEEQELVDDLRALIELGLVTATTDLGAELRLALADGAEESAA
jgi:hypothetical protein